MFLTIKTIFKNLLIYARLRLWCSLTLINISWFTIDFFILSPTSLEVLKIYLISPISIPIHLQEWSCASLLLHRPRIPGFRRRPQLRHRNNMRKVKYVSRRWMTMYYCSFQYVVWGLEMVSTCLVCLVCPVDNTTSYLVIVRLYKGNYWLQAYRSVKIRVVPWVLPLWLTIPTPEAPVRVWRVMPLPP